MSIIRCAYCGVPMWAQTYNSGGRYYREHRNSRGLMECPASGGSVPCDIAPMNGQVRALQKGTGAGVVFSDLSLTT